MCAHGGRVGMLHVAGCMLTFVCARPCSIFQLPTLVWYDENDRDFGDVASQCWRHVPPPRTSDPLTHPEKTKHNAVRVVLRFLLYLWIMEAGLAAKTRTTPPFFSCAFASQISPAPALKAVAFSQSTATCLSQGNACRAAPLHPTANCHLCTHTPTVHMAFRARER